VGGMYLLDRWREKPEPAPAPDLTRLVALLTPPADGKGKPAPGPGPEKKSSLPPTTFSSIAVLPFEELKDRKPDDPFNREVGRTHEAIVKLLTRSGRLKVVTAAVKERIDPVEAGRALKVSAVLVGKTWATTLAGTSHRAAVTLIDVETGRTV